MRLRGLRPEDVVKVDIKGRVFFAEVEHVALKVGEVQIKPINHWARAWRHATANQVVEVYTKRRPRTRKPKGS